VEVDGLRLDVTVDHRPILRVDHRPGAGMIVLGCALAVVALAVAWVFPPQLIWIVVGQDDLDASLLRVLAPSSFRASRWLWNLKRVLADRVESDE
jgi:hypothetical protein